jgi:biotin transport system substrate-specific component
MAQSKVIRNLQSTTLLHDGIIVILASVLIGLFGRVSFPLWYTPVPVVTQSHLVMLLAAILGPRRGVLAVLAFLFQGALGLPVFSSGGVQGLMRFVGPTGGYLVGYVVAAFVVGTIVERAKTKSLPMLTLAFMAGSACLLALGALYLSTFLGFTRAIECGVIPFLIGDAFKSTVSLIILKTIFGWGTRK